MNTAATESDEPVVEVAEAPVTVKATAAPVAPKRRLVGTVGAGLAVVLIAVGGALLMTNLGLLTPEAGRMVAAAWPAGVILAGLGLLLAGDRWWAAELTPFMVARGRAEQADLLASAGTADLRLEANTAPAEQAAAEPAGAELAAGELPWRDGPKIEWNEQRATLRFEPGWALPGWRAVAGEGWRVALAEGLPWRLNLRSSTGNLDVDLAELTVEGVRLHSTFGDVNLTLPAAGGADLDIGLAFGDLRLVVPEGLGVKVKLRRGALADLTHDERRFIRLSPDEVGTPLYAVAARRCTLTVWLGTGTLRLE